MNAGRLQGKDCSQQSFCISTVPGGQMQEGTTPGKEEVELRQEQQSRATQRAVAEVDRVGNSGRGAVAGWGGVGQNMPHTVNNDPI